MSFFSRINKLKTFSKVRTSFLEFTQEVKNVRDLKYMSDNGKNIG